MKDSWQLHHVSHPRPRTFVGENYTLYIFTHTHTHTTKQNKTYNRDNWKKTWQKKTWWQLEKKPQGIPAHIRSRPLANQVSPFYGPTMHDRNHPAHSTVSCQSLLCRGQAQAELSKPAVVLLVPLPEPYQLLGQADTSRCCKSCSHIPRDIWCHKCRSCAMVGLCPQCYHARARSVPCVLLAKDPVTDLHWRSRGTGGITKRRKTWNDRNGKMNKIHSSSVGFQMEKKIPRKESTLEVPGLLLVQLRPVGPQSVNNLSIEVTVKHIYMQSIYNFWWNLSQVLFVLNFISTVGKKFMQSLAFLFSYLGQKGWCDIRHDPPTRGI